MEKKTPYIHKKINKNKINIGKALTPIRYPKKKAYRYVFLYVPKKANGTPTSSFWYTKTVFFFPKKIIRLKINK